MNVKWRIVFKEGQATGTPGKLCTLATAPDLKTKPMDRPVIDSISQLELRAMNGQRVRTILGEIMDKHK